MRSAIASLKLGFKHSIALTRGAVDQRPLQPKSTFGRHCCGGRTKSCDFLATRWYFGDLLFTETFSGYLIGLQV